MKKDLMLLPIKSLIVGMFFAIGIIATSAIGITITTTFTDGDTLTAASLNELRTALVNLPNWIKGDTATDAVYTDGNVGIGTTSPRVALDINGAMAFTSETLTGSTPDVSVSNFYHVSASADETITEFANGTEGQKITVMITGTCGGIAGFTIKHNATKIYLGGSTDFTATSRCSSADITILEFIFNGSVWYETNRTEHLGGC
ncbi:hypothetical protein KJ966_05145 [bacterium]|nr:hypothetical protein [bacterium]